MRKTLIAVGLILIILLFSDSIFAAKKLGTQTNKSPETKKPSTLGNRITELNKHLELETKELDSYLELKKKELKDKNIDIDKITPKEIERLLDSKVLTIDDAENLFPKDKLMKLNAFTVFCNMSEKKLTDDDKETLRLLLTALASEGLYELRFYVGEVPSGKMTPILKNAIKEFQSSLGGETTGEMSLGEIMELFEILEKIRPGRIDLPSFNFFNARKYSDYDYVKLRGTWVFKDGTTQAFPIQTSVIELDKQMMSGFEAMASLNYMPSSASNGSLSADLILWKITKWDSQEIIAENGVPLNASYTLTVDLQNEKAYMFRRHKGEKIFGEVELKPSILELVGGFEVSWDFYKKRDQELQTLYNPKHMVNYEELLKKLLE